MSWSRQATPSACSFCDARIEAGQPVRRSTVESMARIRWCAGCAKRRLDEDVPADLPDAVARVVSNARAALHVTPSARTRPSSKFEGFNRKETGTQLRQNILNWRRDGRMEATGEQGR